jgi:hypothetical protein
MRSMPHRLAAVASAVSVLAVGAPVAGAAAATSTSTSTSTVPLPAFQLPSWSWPALTFVPPAVGPIEVHIGAIIISGNMISPGVNIVMPPITLPSFLSHPAG